LGLVTFLVRIPLPIGYVFQPLNLQVPFLPQYIGLFILGAAAFYGNWLNQLEPEPSRFWRNYSVGLILLMPLLFVFSGGLEGDVTPALGGFHWQSLAYSIWEQFFCLGMIFTLLHHFKAKINKAGNISRELTASTYAVYIFHSPVLVLFTVLFKDYPLPPLLKIALLAAPSLILCFLAGSLVRRLPGIRSVL
jgi:hypothetical protein